MCTGKCGQMCEEVWGLQNVHWHRQSVDESDIVCAFWEQGPGVGAHTCLQARGGMV